MKLNISFKSNFIVASLLLTGWAVTACEDEPDKYEISGGVPTLRYVRMADVAAADSLITGAYMANTICLVGENLRSVYELYFNDQKAILNTSYMSDNTILVDVPKEIPEKVTNKIYMVTKNKDTVDYDFRVLVPAPQVATMSCEFAKPGEEVTLYGDYFLDDPNVPLTISMQGNVEVTQITKITKTSLSFILPDNAPEGYITVKTQYGAGRSQFRYNDTRCILFDWDGSHGGITIGHGWRDGSKVLATEGGLDGSYLRFNGDLDGDSGLTWAEDAFSFNYWPEPSNGYPELSSIPAFAEMIEKYGVENLQIKFECMVPASNPWSSSALQIIFSGNDVVTYATASNAYFSDAAVPRGLWIPWSSTGSYHTDGKWITVSMKLADCNKTHEGKACASPLTKDGLTGLTFFVWAGGLNGTACSPVICVDNIRIAPVE